MEGVTTVGFWLGTVEIGEGVTTATPQLMQNCESSGMSEPHLRQNISGPLKCMRVRCAHQGETQTGVVFHPRVGVPGPPKKLRECCKTALVDPGLYVAVPNAFQIYHC